MPDDEDLELNANRLREYEMLIREAETAVLNDEASKINLLQPLLASFGYGDAFGLYWGALHVLERFPALDLRIALRQAVLDGERGARRWATYMLGRQRNPEDIDVLTQALTDSEEEVRFNALTALTMIGSTIALPAIERVLGDPTSRIRSAAKRSLEQLSS
jgi:HEAT repeat protein